VSEVVQELTASFKYEPRWYQRPVLKAMANGVKRGAMVWHRRSGKDLTMVNGITVQAMKRVGAYYYFFPTYGQGRKVIWEGRTKDGVRFLDYIPKELIDGKPNETEMRIPLVNGSSIQIIGTDNMDHVVGTNPLGCVFSEYSLQNPKAYDLMRPVLRENGGWAWFVYTPRGRNHGYRLWKMAKGRPGTWFSSMLTVNDTFLDAERMQPVITADDLEEERLEGMDEDLLNQEYYCSFDGATQGSYYGPQIALVYKQDRVGFFPWVSQLPVYTAWDIGIGDATAIWFFQLIGEEIRMIDFYEASGKGLDHYAKVLKDREYAYAEHWMPHDIEARELGTGKARIEIARNLGLKPIRVAPRMDIDDGIAAVRKIFSRLRFNERACNQQEYAGHSGFDAIAFYHKKWDDDKHCYALKPEHDWSSHAADALRTLALVIREMPVKKFSMHCITAFNPLSYGQDGWGPQPENLRCETDFNPLKYQEVGP